ncbi:hypothetical protein [Streptomyces subrutilus]|nr:hypothetical protein [Streptomyces subrutilus]
MQYQTCRADKRAVLAAPKYDRWRTIVIPPYLHETHQALLASNDQPWMFLSIQGKPLLSTNFDHTCWFPIRDGAEERASGPRYERWARPALPAVEERMGHELSGVEGTYSEVTLAMEERIVGYLKRVWEEEVVGAALWTPTFPIPLPDSPANPAPSLFSGLPTLEYE